MLIICHKTCTTCKKAKQWLTDQNIPFEERDIKAQNPTREELQLWYEKAGLPIKRWFNTSGNLYKEYNFSRREKALIYCHKCTILEVNNYYMLSVTQHSV